MGDTADKVKEARERIAIATREIMQQSVVIHLLQQNCNHRWGFHNQVNAYNEHLWNVTFRCPECELTSTTKKRPVCETCLSSLVRAKKNDLEAAAEARKHKSDSLGNPPLAFRCPACQAIHVLWHEGD